jgi:hypothetical protein
MVRKWLVAIAALAAIAPLASWSSDFCKVGEAIAAQ